MADIVIISSPADRAVVQVFAAMLERNGITTWGLATEATKPADTTDTIAEHEVTAAHAVAVVWSPRSVSSIWVQHELRQAMRLAKPLAALGMADLDPATIAEEFRNIPVAPLDNEREALGAILGALAHAPNYRGFGSMPAASAPGRTTLTEATLPPPSPRPGGLADLFGKLPRASNAADAELEVADAGPPAGLSANALLELRGNIAAAALPGVPSRAELAPESLAAPPPPQPNYADLEAAEFGAAPLPRPPQKKSLEPADRASRSGSAAGTISALALLAVVAGAAYVFRDSLADISTQLLAVLGLVKGTMPPGPAAGQPATTQPAEAQSDLVDCSVFAPPRAAPDTRIMVQAFLHLVEQSDRVAFMATTMDDTAKLRGIQTLQVPIATGTHVRLVLDGQGLVVDEPIQTIIWRGEPNVAAFSCVVPPDIASGTIHPIVRLYLGDEPVGRILFKLDVAAPARTRSRDLLPGPEMTGTSARCYRQAFLSYASEDRVEVLKRAQALKLANIGFFQDVLSLEPGERYERRLYQKIDEADLFMLFWSRHAKASEWVAKEIEHARACQLNAPDALPDIVPVALDDPRDAPPPEILGDRHFNDTIAALISYEQSRRQGRSWSWRGFFRRNAD